MYKTVSTEHLEPGMPFPKGQFRPQANSRNPVLAVRQDLTDDDFEVLTPQPWNSISRTYTLHTSPFMAWQLI